MIEKQVSGDDGRTDLRQARQAIEAGYPMFPANSAINLARQLLSGSSRHSAKVDIVVGLARLLVEIGIDSSDIERAHPSGSARIDVFLPRYRTAIQAAARGRAAEPGQMRAERVKSARERLERIVAAEIAAERERPPPSGEPRPQRAWTGIVTDGQRWHVRSYLHADDPVASRSTLHSGRFQGSAAELVDALSGWLGREPVGRPWIPAEPGHLFEGHAAELARLRDRMPESVRRATETRRARWHDILRASGMSPNGHAPEHLFVTHSLLVAIARMVTHSILHRGDDWKAALEDGFGAWILDWPPGADWAASLWETVSRHDWRRRRGDVLRSLYQTFVAESDRKVFGEFYTPDWLAGMIVAEALDDEWLEYAIRLADSAIQNGASVRGTGVLDPACGSGTFLYHAAVRILGAPAMQELQPTRRADVAALLVNGIDVHPVAVEIARANLMRALPAAPTAGPAAIRIHLGDSLLIREGARHALATAAPRRLFKRKVDRIVANPPWVKLSGIQEIGRKRSMETLGVRLGLQAGGKQSPHLDIASFFVLRSRELYLSDPARDPAVWLVKKSALSAGQWGPFREKHRGTLKQSVDLTNLQPFGGGDARKCCLLMEHRGLRNAEVLKDAAQAADRPRLEARLVPASGPRRLGKPSQGESWDAVRERVQVRAVPDPLPQAASEYGTKAFRQGATVVPHVLLVAESAYPHGDRVRVKTRRSMHMPWRAVPPQEVEIPRRWLAKLYRSPDMLAFVASADDTQAIIPVDAGGNLDLESAMAEVAWRDLDKIYRGNRGQGTSTPKTLAQQVDYARKLSSQMGQGGPGKRMVLYPSSGDIMRAARTQPGTGHADSTLYWHVAGSPDEAAYLTAMLNAPCLRRAFLESRESGRHFQLHPWRKVPIPRYDAESDLHRELTRLCHVAEEAALRVARGMQCINPLAGQKELSRAIREQLLASGPLRAIDEIARQLLPDQAE